MTGAAWVLPFHRLPRGFLRLLDDPPDPPAFPRPSATLVLIRQGPRQSTPGEGGEEAGLEVLLLKRSPRSGFIPGAWVFPGGTVDEEDGDPRLLPLLEGLSPHQARDRFTLGNPRTPPGAAGDVGDSGAPPPWAYWVAAIRETFEETGILLRKEAPEAPGEDALNSARMRVLNGEEGFRESLEALGLSLDTGSLEYNGHWLTPECEPRRYETRFFVTEVTPGVEVTPHEKEMVDALWLTPEEALERNREGDFPLVLPTLFTLQELRSFQTPAEALGFLRHRRVPRRLPRPERAEGGVLFRIQE